jgi:hypothetical protein
LGVVAALVTGLAPAPHGFAWYGLVLLGGLIMFIGYVIDVV